MSSSFIFSWACVKNKCDLSVILIFSSLHMWLIVMNYAFTSLTPVWCEVNVFLIFLHLSFLFFCLFSLLLSLFFFILVYSFLVIQSDIEELISNVLVLYSLVNSSFINIWDVSGILCSEKVLRIYCKYKTCILKKRRQIFRIK